jgi:glutamate/tyrosine decarboxylase-like PLP-dependent enzyme
VVDPDAMARAVDEDTALIVGSAGNYPYGTIDPIGALSDLALERGVGLHVDGCLGGFILPWGEQLGYDIPAFDFRLPGVTAISADTHKYGYGLKGTSTLLFADHALREQLYYFKADWQGGKYLSPGIAGSRSGGLLAATWAAMVTMGRRGYLERARGVFETSFAMQEVVRSHDELRIFGDPTFCFAFTTDAFEIYHVNDFMNQRGWRFNGLQYPNGLHFAVTGPQLRDGLVDEWATDLAEAIAYGHEHAGEAPTSAAIYGGVPGGSTPEAEAFLREFAVAILDGFQSLPPEA